MELGILLFVVFLSAFGTIMLGMGLYEKIWGKK